MKAVEALACLELAAVLVAAADTPRPRGVGPEFAKYYKDPTDFTCISAPSIRVPLARLNDDYCDCPDGSDEPGTSACGHLSPLSPQTPGDAIPTNMNATLALPGFYCKNKGHMPSYVPFTAVNDGHCDYDLCCDGSEEWGGLVKCEDRCKEIGAEWRKADEARRISHQAAAKKRNVLVAEAAKLKKELQARIATLGTEIEGGEKKVQQMEEEVAVVEKREKGKIVKAGATGGKLGVLVELAKRRVKEVKDALVRVRRERDSSRKRVAELEELLSTFKDEYNPNFNDEGVKRAVRAWEEYVAAGKLTEDDIDYDEVFDQTLDQVVGADKDNGLDWEEYEKGDEGSDTGVLYSFENYLPPTIRGWLDQKLRDLRVTLIESGILAGSSSSSSGESKAVTDARDRLQTAKDDLENSRRSLKESKEDLEKDMGRDDIFRALKGTCIEVDSGEYTYETCFLGDTTQKPKKGGGNVNMGHFEKLDKVVVDDPVSADGKGLGSGERIALRYENGQHCWNGPSRSTTVILACAENSVIWKVVEEEKCVYRMEVGSPAACEPLSNSSAQKAEAAGGKDEL